MKSNLIVSLLLMGWLFVSCSVADIPDEGVISPVSAPDDIIAFFEEHLPKNSQTFCQTDFKFSDMEFSENECFLINSKSEFKAVVTDGVEVPDIDFRQYSLIIGQCVLGDPGYTLREQVVGLESDEMVLQLEYMKEGGVSPCIITNFYFWGLYPKLPDLPLEVEMDII